jgi:methyltransferase-like protein
LTKCYLNGQISFKNIEQIIISINIEGRMNDLKNQEYIHFLLDSIENLDLETQIFLTRLLIYFADDNRPLEDDELLHPLLFKKNNE